MPCDVAQVAERASISAQGGGADGSGSYGIRMAGACCNAPARGKGGTKLRILLVVSNLEYGGAQRQVIALANGFNAIDIETHVCCLSPYTPLRSDLNDSDRYLHLIEKRSKLDVSVAPRLARLVRHLRVTVLHGFLLDADVACRLAGAMVGGLVVVGSERNTDYEVPIHHEVVLRATRQLVDGVIANSHAGRRFHKRRLGVPDERLFVVHNGVDVTRFAPASKLPLRRELGIPPDAPVIAMVASFKRQKNHLLFFRMARRVLVEFPAARFLCVGEALHQGLQASGAYLEQMKTAIRDMGIEKSVLLTGNRNDPVNVYNGCDITALTSRREGTPNVLLESMACGVPVVATNVSDNALVVPDGEVGYIVPDGDEAALADRVIRLLRDPKLLRRFSSSARHWVSSEFSIEALVRKTREVYLLLLNRRRELRCS